MQTQHQVTIEATPNPATLKFNFSSTISEESFEVPSAQDSERSPLAAKIFGFPWTASIFVGRDFITVTKQDWVEWSVLGEPLRGLIQEHLESGEPVTVQVAAADIEATDSEIVKKIKQVLNAEIRPVVALDGGDIVFHSYEDNVLYVRMKGACSGCPSSTATLKDGIEVRMKEVLPEIKEVVSV